VKTIAREALKEKMDRRDDFLLLEVLGEVSFNRALAPDRSTEIVAYCSNFN
jgi:hypothetical protein